MSFAIELVVFEPASGANYGMLVFASTDAGLLRYLLMNHGEWGDNTSWWSAGHAHDGHLHLRCRLHGAEGTAYRKRLAPCLAAASCSWSHQRDGMDIRLSSFWYVHRRAVVERMVVPAACRSDRARVRGFPCDGAIALDASALPEACHDRIPELFGALLQDQPEWMERWQARAECCFLLHLQPSDDDAFPCINIRETPFRDRRASLIEMWWPVSRALLKGIGA